MTPELTPTHRTKRAVVACMKNEGMFVLEWVAYHLSIGFDKVFVLTNNCADGTDAILDRLAQHDAVIHINNPVEPGQRPQVEGLRLALAHPQMLDVEWLLHIDADEFLNVTIGEGHVQDLLNAVGDCDVIALAWRLMGSGGRKFWAQDSLLASQTHTDAEPKFHILRHKSMFRPNRFGSAIDHMPKDPLSGTIIAKNAAGTQIPADSLFKPKHSRFRGIEREDMTWQNADIHHYAVRSEDVFLLKNIRGDGMNIEHSNYHLGSPFHRQIECNRTTDTSIQRNLPALNARLARYRADADLAALDDAAFAWFAALRNQHLTDENRAKWIFKEEVE